MRFIFDLFLYLPYLYHMHLKSIDSNVLLYLFTFYVCLIREYKVIEVSIADNDHMMKVEKS